MILTGDAIQKAINKEDIIISPFKPSCLNPNSYDFHLGNRCRTYKEHVLDASKENSSVLRTVDDSGITLSPEKIYLFNTVEKIGSDKYVPIIRARSSVARLGLFIHITADLIDIGSINQLTLQFHAVVPVKVFPGMRIGQVTFWVCDGPIRLYDGKYGNIESPSASLSYQDF